MADSQNTIDVEQLMARIQSSIDAHPDSKALLEGIQECRLYAGGVYKITPFNNDLTSKTKSFIYKCLMRAFRGNFERQSLFNHAIVNTMQLMAEDLDKIRRSVSTNNDDKN